MPTITKRRKPLPPNLTIEEMLKRKTFDQLIEDRDIYEPKDAAPLMGYAPMHVRYLCREGKVEHVEREGCYFLYARTVHGAVKHAPAKKNAKRA